MKKNQFLTLLLLSVFSLLLLSACTPKGQEPGTTSDNSAPGVVQAAKKIILMTNDTTFPGFEEYRKAAEAATGLTIETITSPSNSTDRLSKITTILSSGDDSVDIIAIDDEMMSQYKSAGFLEPLQETVMTPDIFSNFQTEYMKARTMVGENIYSVPMYTEILAYWIDEAKVKSAGLEASPKNLDEFMQFVSANSGDQKFGYGGAWEKTYVFNEIGTFVNLFGGDYLDWTNPNSRKAVEFMYDLLKDGYTAKAQLADQYDPMMQKMFDGTYASLFMYTGALQTFIDSGKYGPDGIHMAPMPTFERNTAYMASWHYVLNKESKNKEAAIEFLKWAASPDGEKAYFAMCSRMPARKDVVLDPTFEATGVEDFRQYLENTTLLARDMAPQAMEFISAIGSLFQQYVSDEITLDAFCEQAQKEVETYMPKE